MNENYSRASKARWAKIPPEMRSKMMRELVAKKYKKMTKEQLSAHGKRMADGRYKK